MERLLHYFPELSAVQVKQFQHLAPLYREWNDKINVISRRDIDNLYLHHVLHSLGIAEIIQFLPGTRVLDLGTGGGFPGIPLAIFFPQTEFILIDGTRKKIQVVAAVQDALALENVVARHQRAEDLHDQFDFVVCRAVASLEKLVAWSQPLIQIDPQRHPLPNGLLALKGGNLNAEIEILPRAAYTELYPLSDFFVEPYFEEKSLVYVQR